jgi:hypothetical protein
MSAFFSLCISEIKCTGLPNPNFEVTSRKERLNWDLGCGKGRALSALRLSLPVCFVAAERTSRESAMQQQRPLSSCASSLIGPTIAVATSPWPLKVKFAADAPHPPIVL